MWLSGISTLTKSNILIYKHDDFAHFSQSTCREHVPDIWAYAYIHVYTYMYTYKDGHHIHLCMFTYLHRYIRYSKSWQSTRIENALVMPMAQKCRLVLTIGMHIHSNIHASGKAKASKTYVWKRPGEMSTGKHPTHYRLSGPPEGRLVICIHAMGTASFFFDELAHLLAGKGFLVLQYDLMGAGYSNPA